MEISFIQVYSNRKKKKARKNGEKEEGTKWGREIKEKKKGFFQKWGQLEDRRHKSADGLLIALATL